MGFTLSSYFEFSFSLTPASWAAPAPFLSGKDSLAAWKPAFDPSEAQCIYLLSNVDHPSIDGIAVGNPIKNKVRDRSHGRLYVDFRPLVQLGGEKDVIQMLKMEAVKGMLCSSVAAAIVSPKLGIVNLPFVVNTFKKFEEFSDNSLPQGIMVVDFTGYGT